MTGKYPPRFGITDFIPGMRSGKLKSAPNAGHLPLEEIRKIMDILNETGATEVSEKAEPDRYVQEEND